MCRVLDFPKLRGRIRLTKFSASYVHPGLVIGTQSLCNPYRRVERGLVRAAIRDKILWLMCELFGVET